MNGMNGAGENANVINLKAIPMFNNWRNQKVIDCLESENKRYREALEKILAISQCWCIENLQCVHCQVRTALSNSREGEGMK